MFMFNLIIAFLFLVWGTFSDLLTKTLDRGMTNLMIFIGVIIIIYRYVYLYYDPLAILLTLLHVVIIIGFGFLAMKKWEFGEGDVRFLIGLTLITPFKPYILVVFFYAVILAFAWNKLFKTKELAFIPFLTFSWLITLIQVLI